MSAAPGPVTTPPAAPAPSAGNAPEPADPPRLAEGIELLGEFKNSGYGQPPSLVRRADGQIIQMSRLLYSVACRINGSRGPAAIAELISDDLGRPMTADQVRYLIAVKLLPLGVVDGQGTSAAPPKANPLLALRARGTLLPERAANAAGTVLRPLYRWPAVVAVIASVAAVDYWLFAEHGLTAGLGQVLRDPADLLIVFGLSLVSAVFHECGHAAGCRYGGGRPGKIGVGIYLVWPSFFTNVTDSYRLSRGGRLRTDLGGLYFNLIFILVMVGLYEATSAETLLLVVAVTHLEMLQQLLPFVRFDGYFILSDLVGVPDLFARVGPILRSVLSTSGRDPRPADLRRTVRIVVTGWVLCVIPLLALTIGYLLLHLPQINRALWHTTSLQAHRMVTAVAARHYAVAAIDAVGVALAALSITGSLYVLTGLSRRAGAMGLRWSAGRPVRRLLITIAAAAFVASLAVYWAIQGQYRGW